MRRDHYSQLPGCPRDHPAGNVCPVKSRYTWDGQSAQRGDCSEESSSGTSKLPLPMESKAGSVRGGAADTGYRKYYPNLTQKTPHFGNISIITVTLTNCLMGTSISLLVNILGRPLTAALLPLSRSLKFGSIQLSLLVSNIFLPCLY